MPIHESEAVVLRQYSLAEADRIVVFFTREFGKLRAVVQGAKRTKSRLGGCVEPLNHINLSFYLKEGADLARIRQCETIHSYLGKQPTLEQVYAFTYMAELVQEVVQDNNPNPILFRLFLASMKAGQKHNATPALLRYFEFWTLRLIGLLPNYDYCSACGTCLKDQGFYAGTETGQGRCRKCAQEQGMFIRPASASLLAKVLKQSPDEFAAIALQGQDSKELERWTQKLLELHLEKRLKSYRDLKQILRD